METLDAIRRITARGDAVPLWSEPSGAPAADLATATHAVLDEGAPPTPLDTPVPLRSTKGVLTLRSVVYAWAMRDAQFNSYLMGAITVGGGATATTVPERSELLEWLKGTKTTCSLLAAAAAAAAAEAAAADGGAAYGADPMDVDGPNGFASGSNLVGLGPDTSLGGVGGGAASQAAGYDVYESEAERSARIARNEYTLRDRTTYLTPPGNKVFTHLTKLSYDVFIRNKAPPKPVAPAAAAAAAAAGARGKQSLSARTGLARRTGGAGAGGAGGDTDPIILIPPGFNTLVSMFNVQQLLEGAKFETTESVRAASKDGKPTSLEIVRKGPGKKAWKVTVYDSADRLTSPADWDRVIAVFAGGMAWQFTGWRWANPVDLFSNVRGYHVKYHDEETPANVNTWNVRVFSVHRNKRHLDLPLVLDIWADLEKWVATHKPHLLP
ncbi:accessory factor associated with RNA polymerase II [Blastocladiella emersonii ATCC 22665]|nr:accessory factor associated with RNA polymerase II [Blastocladiella emersonii ATCC 22665]